MSKFIYLLYDSRYIYDPRKAALYTECNSLNEAKKDKNEMFPDAVIVRCIDDNGLISDHKIIEV